MSQIGATPCDRGVVAATEPAAKPADKEEEAKPQI